MRLRNELKNNKQLKKVSRRLSPIILPGFQGVHLGLLFEMLKKSLFNNRLFDRAAATTYFFFMAFPPTLLFIFTLLPYLPLKGFQAAIMRTLVYIIPNQNTYNTIAATLNTFFNKERTDLLSFGVLLTLYFSSNGMMSLMRAFDRYMPFYVHRSGIRRRWTAIRLTVLVIVTMIFTLSALVLQTKKIDRYIAPIFPNAAVPKLISVFIIVVLIFFTISMIYRFGPSLEKRMPLVSPGSIFASSAFVFITIVFFFMVNNFLNYDVVYGPIGSLIAFMVWLYLLNIVLIVGYELNVSILMSKWKMNSKSREIQHTAADYSPAIVDLPIKNSGPK